MATSKKSRDRQEAKEKKRRMDEYRASALAKRSASQIKKAADAVKKSRDKAPKGSETYQRLNNQLKELSKAQGAKSKTTSKTKSTPTSTKTFGFAGKSKAEQDAILAQIQADYKAGKLSTADVLKANAELKSNKPVAAKDNPQGFNYNVNGIDRSNEYEYLKSLVAKGGGEAQWAKEQAAIYGMDLDAPLSQTAGTTTATGGTGGVVDALGGYGGTSGAGEGGPSDGRSNRPTRAPGDELTNDYGITNDRQTIEDILNKSIDAKYKGIYKQQDRIENDYYDRMATVSDTMTDLLRKDKLNAIQTGASKGMQAANMLSASLGIGKEAGLGATELARGRADIAFNEGADRTNASQVALETANQLGVDIGKLAANMYNADAVNYGSEMNYLATTDSASLAALAQQYAANAASRAQMYASDKAYASNVYATDNAKAYGGGSGYSNDNPYSNAFGMMSPAMQQAMLLARETGISYTDALKELYPNGYSPITFAPGGGMSMPDDKPKNTPAGGGGGTGGSIWNDYWRMLNNGFTPNTTPLSSVPIRGEPPKVSSGPANTIWNTYAKLLGN